MRSVCLLALLLTPSAWAFDAAESIRRSLEAPRQLLSEGRALIEADAPTAAHQRELLLDMVRAAQLLSRRAEVEWAIKRLRELEQRQAADGAEGYALLAEASLKMLDGDYPSAMETVLRAGDHLRDAEDPLLRLRGASGLCEILTDTGHADRAEADCARAETLADTVALAYERARVQNLRLVQRFHQDRYEEAVAHGERAQALAVDAGLVTFASVMDDNLARLLLELGRAEEALLRSRRALTAEEASGRREHAALSHANVARALIQLGRPQEAASSAERSVAEGRDLLSDAVLGSSLPVLLEALEAAGRPAGALAAAREYVEWLEGHSAERTRRALAELEARYAAAEREREIEELRQQGLIKSLELKASRAEFERSQESLQRQRLALGLVLLGALSVLAVAALLWRLLRQQRAQAAELARLARTDPLTGLDNRRALFERFELACRKPASEGSQPILLVLDLDHFKRINDRHGHPVGDAVLRDLAELLRREAPEVACVARIGGEEFAVLLLDCSLASAQALAERILQSTRDYRSALVDAQGLRLSLSAGLASRREGESPEQLYRRADQALYRAKESGRDRLVVAGDADPEEERAA
ncbi:MAG: GGDEF domain-containing protein [Aquimonas sp.]|nr:GGDEF domain-containing protein [Aquimonas sp.]